MNLGACVWAIPNLIDGKGYGPLGVLYSGTLLLQREVPHWQTDAPTARTALCAVRCAFRIENRPSRSRGVASPDSPPPVCLRIFGIMPRRARGAFGRQPTKEGVGGKKVVRRT